MSRVPNAQLHPNDKYLSRARNGRVVVLILYVGLVLGICIFICWKIASDWFGFGLAGIFAGLAASGILLSMTLDRFFISVEMVSAFITVDLFQTLFWKKDRAIPDPETYDEESEEEKELDRKTFPVYGPGFHVSYPWEERDQENNFSLKEVSADISFSILLSDGTITMKGSYRIRPDLNNLIPFLSGVGSSAEELEEIIVAYAIEFFDGMTVDEALSNLGELNEALNAKFGLKTKADGRADSTETADKVSDFERRFGVYVGDITIAEILPSKEVQRTRGSITEARAIAEGTAILLGFKNAAALARARSQKKIADEQVSRARDRFLSISGNMEGMELKRNEFDFNVTGLDPETVKALAPALAMAAAVMTNKNSTKK